MEIFGKHIFGSDAEQWLKLPVLEQVNWIKSRTRQQNDDIINEFLANIPANNDKNCLNCGNISKTISTEVTANTEPIDNGIISTKDSIKRPRATKRGKN